MLAKFYHQVFSYPDSDFVLASLNQTGGPLLDLGCATGRVLEIANSGGFVSFGIDSSLEMIEFGKQLHSQKKNIFWFCQDFLEEVKLHERVGTLTCLANTYAMLLEFEARRNCFRLADKYLRPGGQFLIYVKSDTPDLNNCKTLKLRTPEGQLTFTLRFEEDFRNFLRTYTLNFQIGNKFADYVFQTRIFSLVSLLAEFKEFGFQCISSSSDFQGTPIRHDSSIWVFCLSRGGR